MKRIAPIWMILAGGMWLSMALPAAAQSRAPFSTPSYAAYATSAYTQPAVSPYLNLGVTPDGISNYQTLVRPMIESREAIEWQQTNLQQLQRQMQSQGGRREGATGPAGVRSSAGTYMNYSHFYNGIR